MNGPILWMEEKTWRFSFTSTDAVFLTTKQGVEYLLNEMYCCISSVLTHHNWSLKSDGNKWLYSYWRQHKPLGDEEQSKLCESEILPPSQCEYHSALMKKSPQCFNDLAVMGLFTYTCRFPPAIFSELGSSRCFFLFFFLHCCNSVLLIFIHCDHYLFFFTDKHSVTDPLLSHVSHF